MASIPSEALSTAPTLCYTSPERARSVVEIPIFNNASWCHGCPRGKGNMDFCETFLKTPQEWHHLEVFDDLSSIFIILQSIQLPLDTGLILFQVHRVNYRERRVVVSVMNQHCFEVPG